MLSNKENTHYDVIVIGAGHAGCEAAHASARLGARTLLITMDLTKIAQMSCNPAVGGIAKGQIVCEIDALGGMMARVTDASTLQFRMLNRSKGPAVWSPRAQCDNRKFSATWRKILETTDNLWLWQDEVIGIETVAHSSEENGTDGPSPSARFRLDTLWGAGFTAQAVIVTAGTFLNGLMHVGRTMVPGGRCAEPASVRLTASLERLGIRHERMKTGTPVRIDARSVHFHLMQEQRGETGQFSLLSPTPQAAALTAESRPERSCWLTATNSRTHDVLRAALDESPLYNGQIQSIGPRYCPSIETKLHTFPDRDSHPLFLEPEGADSSELYLNGFSSSLPLEVQLEALRTIPCFADVHCLRPGYAIEYDFFPPQQLRHSLESKRVEGLYFAGQVNGTTGYEEAAGQGLLAGINAARQAQGLDPVVLGRDQAYIGVLIDDLVTKGVDEPYRMFTSRAEFRILLRQDNADARLTPLAESIGMISPEQARIFRERQERISELVAFCRTKHLKPAEANDFLRSIGEKPLERGECLFTLVSRPAVRLSDILPLTGYPAVSPKETECAETLIKYDGYIQRERATAEKMHTLENIKIRGRFDYAALKCLSTEARQKLQAVEPETLGQASRIPGVSQSDVAALMVLASVPRETF